MEANLASLVDFITLSNTQFIIPVYQRYYDWQEIQCRQMLKDIRDIAINDSLPSHFIGSIVFIQDSVYGASRKKILTIIDGQQRLTTITLLLLALSHKCLEAGYKEKYEEILEDYVINKRFEEEKIKLRPIKKDDKALQYLIAADFTHLFGEYSRVIENYYFFKGDISEKEIDTILKGISKLYFVEVSLERGKDEPQRIFESLNSTGLDLSQADLIRNYVLMDVEPETQKRIYENYWIKIENNTIENKTKQNKLSDFIRDFLTLKFREIPNKNKVFHEFRRRYSFSKDQAERHTQIESILKEIKDYSLYYYNLINYNDADIPLKIKQQLKYINHLEINVAYPFLLEVLKDFHTEKIDETIFYNVLKVIQSFVWRRFIIGLPTNALNKIFMTLYQHIGQSDYVKSLEHSLLKKTGTQRFPNDTEITEELKVKDFYNIQTKNRLYYLEKLENHGKAIPFQIEGNEKVTTEHILPQNPSNEWKARLGSQLSIIHGKYLNTIANLTISGNNGELSNKPFLAKRDLPDYGYKESGLWLNQYLSNISEWSEIEILERLKIITDKTLSIWSYPIVEQIDEEETEEENIFALESVTSKRIDYFIFFDKRYEATYFSELYQIVIQVLFDLDAERFFDTELSNIIKISKDKSAIRQSAAISSSYYIDTNMSANAIIQKIQKVLSFFDLEDELYIKLQN